MINLKNEVNITVIATGFDGKEPITGFEDEVEPDRVIRELDEDIPVTITKPIEKPLLSPVAEVDKIEINRQIEEEPFLFTREETPEPSVNEMPVENELNDEPEKIKYDLEKEEPIVGNVADIEKEIFNIKEEVELDQTNTETEKQYFELNEDLADKQMTFDAFEAPATPPRAEVQNVGPTAFDIQKINDERLKRIRENTMKMRNPNGLQDLESIPAYKRNNVNLEKVPHSSESEISRLSISNEGTDDQPKIQIKENNSFLHDNVD